MKKSIVLGFLALFVVGLFAFSVDQASAALACTRYGTPIGVSNPFGGRCPSDKPNRVDGTTLPAGYAYCCMTNTQLATYNAALGEADDTPGDDTDGDTGGDDTGGDTPGDDTDGDPLPENSGGTLTINFENPLKFNTVEEVLTSVMSALRGIVVTLALVVIVIGGIMYITSAGNSGRIDTAKKAITAALIGLALVLAAPSFLKEIALALGWDNIANDQVSGALTLTAIATKVLNFLLGIVGVLAIIMLLVGAIMYLTAAGDQGRADTGKSIVKYSIIGILVALASLVMVTQVASFFT